MKILAVDISALFRRNWEATQGTELAEAMPRTLAAVAKYRDGWDRVAICCDSGPSFRRLIWESYKANRTDPGEAYREQLRRTVERLRQDRCSVFRAPEHVPAGMSHGLAARYFAEADDVIAALCAWAIAEGHEVRILTSDKDLMQLIDDERGIDILKPDKGAVADESYLRDKLGISPQKLPLFLALAGDDSDNFKPYRGLADGRAAALIKAYAPGPEQGIEAIFAHIHDAASILTEPVAKRIAESGLEPGRKALAVATLVRDLGLDFSGLTMEPTCEPMTEAGREVAPVAPEGIAMQPAATEPSSVAPEPPKSSETALVRRPPSDGYALAPYALEPSTPKGAWWLAQQIHESRLFQKKVANPAVAYLIVMEGRALGMSAVVALKNAYLVYGVVAWSARVLRGLCIRSPECEYFEITEKTLTAAAARWKRRGRPEETLRITIEEARARGFVKEAGQTRNKEDGNKWASDPKVMLIACVEREGARLGFPEIVSGLVTPDEVQEDGRTIDAEFLETA